MDGKVRKRRGGQHPIPEGAWRPHQVHWEQRWGGAERESVTEAVRDGIRTPGEIATGAQHTMGYVYALTSA